MNLLFLGLMYNRQNEPEYLRKSKSTLPGAINTFQWNLIDGLKACPNVELQIINTVPVGTYPKQYSAIAIPSRIWQYDNINCYEAGYINLPILKMEMRKKKLLKIIFDIITSYNGESINIIFYSLYLPFLEVIKRIKERFSNVTVTVIVPDLPCQYGILPKKKIKKALMMKYGQKTLSYSEYIDSYILLTEYMKYPLKINNKPYCVIEGIAGEIRNESNIKRNNKKVIMYTGTLIPEFGIKKLIEAFEQINGMEYELWICGSGGIEDEIRSIQKRDNRIQFFGYVEKNKILEMQENATVMVNPRTNEGEYTKYSFPSKTMEYMASGKPVVMYKLDGIPDEYDEYLNYVDTDCDDISGLKNAILNVTNNYDIMLKKAAAAKKFVLENKNGKAQAMKIITFLNENNNNKY